jgi:hypothetical protein
MNSKPPTSKNLQIKKNNIPSLENNSKAPESKN